MVKNKELLIVFNDVLTELKEIKLLLMGKRPLLDEHEAKRENYHPLLSNMEIGEDKTTETPQKGVEVRETTTEKCQECEQHIIYNRGIVEVDKFYCLPCWKVKMTREMIDEVKEKQPEKKGLHGINEVMGGVMDAQKKHVERMKAGENPVECEKCHQFKYYKDCSYDPARNRYICGDCKKKKELDDKLEQKKKLEQEINQMKGRDPDKE